MGMFEWDDARYFLSLHRNGTLSSASRDLGINQSTVGRRLAAIEERLGARLFVRTRDGYRISPAGEKFLGHAERMEDEAHAIAREITGEETRLTGTVRITTPDVLGPRVVVPMLAGFHAKYPEIELEVDADDRIRNLSKREAEMAVRGGRPSERGVVVRKLAPLVSTAYASRTYVEARGGARNGRFDGHDLILFGEPLTMVSEARWLEQRASKARVAFRSSSTYARHHAVLAGLGVATLPCYIGDADESLVRLVEPRDGIQSDVWLVVHRDLQHTARVRACAEHLAAEFRGLTAVLSGKARRERK